MLNCIKIHYYIKLLWTNALHLLILCLAVSDNNSLLLLTWNILFYYDVRITLSPLKYVLKFITIFTFSDNIWYIYINNAQRLRITYKYIYYNL